MILGATYSFSNLGKERLLWNTTKILKLYHYFTIQTKMVVGIVFAQFVQFKPTFYIFIIS